MNRPELYQKTVDILVAAYFNDTLEHGNYCGCAVGNIIAVNMGIDIFKRNGSGCNLVTWYSPELDPNQTDANEWYGQITLKGKELIASTGYPIEEILLIENAFESSDRYSDNSVKVSKDERMFKGLMKVIQALDNIHENTDTQITQTSKSKFNKKLVTI